MELLRGFDKPSGFALVSLVQLSRQSKPVPALLPVNDRKVAYSAVFDFQDTRDEHVRSHLLVWGAPLVYAYYFDNEESLE